MSARYSFNREAFRLFVRAQRTIRHANLSMDQLAAIAGVTKSTIFRAEHCQPIARENFLALCPVDGHEPVRVPDRQPDGKGSRRPASGSGVT